MSLKKNVFRLEEIMQGAIGSFTAVLLFFALRGGQPFSFNPKHGLLITILLLLVYFKGFKMEDKIANFISNFTIAFVVSALMAVTFGIVTSPEIFTFGVFGTPVIIGVWLGFPTALLFDKYDFTNPLKRQYVRK
jgi:hypothetical protein